MKTLGISADVTASPKKMLAVNWDAETDVDVDIPAIDGIKAVDVVIAGIGTLSDGTSNPTVLFTKLEVLTVSQKPIMKFTRFSTITAVQKIFFASQPQTINTKDASVSFRLPVKIPSNNQEKITLRFTCGNLTDMGLSAYKAKIYVTAYFGTEVDQLRIYDGESFQGCDADETYRKAIEPSGKLLAIISENMDAEDSIDMARIEHEGQIFYQVYGNLVIGAEVNAYNIAHVSGVYILMDIPDLSPINNKTFYEIDTNALPDGDVDDTVKNTYIFLEAIGTPKAGTIQEQGRNTLASMRNNNVAKFLNNFRIFPHP
jgi:hypothetical protein